MEGHEFESRSLHLKPERKGDFPIEERVLRPYRWPKHCWAWNLRKQWLPSWMVVPHFTKRGAFWCRYFGKRGTKKSFLVKAKVPNFPHIFTSIPKTKKSPIFFSRSISTAEHKMRHLFLLDSPAAKNCATKSKKAAEKGAAFWIPRHFRLGGIASPYHGLAQQLSYNLPVIWNDCSSIWRVLGDPLLYSIVPIFCQPFLGVNCRQTLLVLRFIILTLILNVRSSVTCCTSVSRQSLHRWQGIHCMLPWSAPQMKLEDLRWSTQFPLLDQTLPQRCPSQVPENDVSKLLYTNVFPPDRLTVFRINFAFIRIVIFPFLSAKYCFRMKLIFL